MNVTMTMDEYQDLLAEMRENEIKVSQLKEDWENMKRAFDEAKNTLDKENIPYSFLVTSSAHNKDVYIPYKFGKNFEF